MLPNIHILGIQGSGKGTQSALLVEKYNLDYISSGNLFRERASQNDALGHQIANNLKAGQLLSTEVLLNTVDNHLKNNKIQHGLLCDGVIRTLDQYNKLTPVWTAYNLENPFLIDLVLDEEEAVKRIEHRQQELSNPEKQEYHLRYSGKLLQRTDDNPLAIKERFALFHRLTQPVVNVFQQENQCINSSANQEIEAIHAQICIALSNRYPLLSYVTH